MVSDVSRSAVQVGSKRTEIREIPLPEVPPDAGILRVIAAGICGSDIGKYSASTSPRILGHENVGTIEKIGPIAAERWGLKIGDMVALEEYLPCGHCDFCRTGEYRVCIDTDRSNANVLRYGTTPLDLLPSLWGGYSEFQFLHPRSVFHRVPEGVDPRIAAMALPVGNGFQWAYIDGGAGPGDVVVVQGPGQQGLACAVAAKVAGASKVIVTGLKRDAHRLEVAKQLGADHTVMVDEESLVDAVKTFTNGEGVDLVIDVASGGDNQVVADGLKVLKKRGRFMTAANKKHVDGFEWGVLLAKRITLRGVGGHSFRSVELALDLMRRKTFPLEAMSTHHFGLDKVDYALRLVGGEIQDGAIHVTVTPWN
jgi:threonine dehydrogenase-like Zn-dependent dehydrogenase